VITKPTRGLQTAVYVTHCKSLQYRLERVCKNRCWFGKTCSALSYVISFFITENAAKAFKQNNGYHCNKVHLNYVKCIVLFTHHIRIV